MKGFRNYVLFPTMHRNYTKEHPFRVILPLEWKALFLFSVIYNFFQEFLTVTSMHGWKGLAISIKYAPECMGCCYSLCHHLPPQNGISYVTDYIDLIVDDFFLLYWWLARLTCLSAWWALLNASGSSLWISLKHCILTIVSILLLL